MLPERHTFSQVHSLSCLCFSEALCYPGKGRERGGGEGREVRRGSRKRNGKRRGEQRRESLLLIPEIQVSALGL